MKLNKPRIFNSVQRSTSASCELCSLYNFLLYIVNKFLFQFDCPISICYEGTQFGAVVVVVVVVLAVVVVVVVVVVVASASVASVVVV